MSWHWNKHGLPFLPGYTVRDVTKSSFHRPQTLGYKNGYALPRRPTVGIGQDPLLSEQLIQQKITELSMEMPDITYGACHDTLPESFVPAHVALDKKVLRFYAYFEEEVLYSPEEVYRVRPVVIYYYLEDDSMCIYEPVVENSGIPQGKRIKRQRLPKNEHGEHYQWKDLNLRMELEVYGVKYHLTDCDAFTKEFMESEGIALNDPAQMPVDSHSKMNRFPQPHYKTSSESSEFDTMHKFLTMSFLLGQVLRFFALWDDTDEETKPVTIHYYLVDDTVEIREIHEANSGRDPFPVLMRRERLPKKLKPEPFPSCVLEVSKHEVEEYYSPKDFQLGQTMNILGRRFLLYDCDAFTEEYFKNNYPGIEMKPIEMSRRCCLYSQEIPPYNGFGSLEDSLQNCLSLLPEPPKRNVLKMLENDQKVLRYTAKLVSQNPEDEDRLFILSYFLSDDMISIFEKPSRNSGIIGGKFLEKTRVPKPGSSVENPEFYSPADLAIGVNIEVFSHRFVLTNADHYVLTYLEANSSQIPSQTLDSLRQKLGVGTASNQPGDQNGTIVI
uniref:EF-hand domain (C-terminal) containing 1 n=1 Tax=Echeneis naucrates TaxID=173247 RepID=A0A665X2G0_ECHNA